MRLPETLRTEKPELSEEEWNRISGLIDEALTMTDLYRLEEGKAMEGPSQSRLLHQLGYLENLSHGGGRPPRHACAKS
jgi:hypothetical protein